MKREDHSFRVKRRVFQKFSIALWLAVLALAPNFASAGPEPTDASFVTSDGVKIHYITLGEGVPVILIHGYMLDAQINWIDNGVAAALAETNRVIAVDVRGHGLSDKPHDADRYGEQLWRDIVELMDHLKIEKTHVHGYSMGGYITTNLLIQVPERFITASYGGSGVEETDPARVAEVPADEEGRPARQSDAVGALFANPRRDPEAMKALMTAFGGQFNPEIDLSMIEIPVLAINGGLDKPNEKTHRMKRELKNFDSLVLPGESHLTAIMPGHMPPEYPARLARFIRENNPKP